MTVNNDVSLYDIYETTRENSQQNKLYISQQLFDEAQDISTNSEYYGLIYDQQVVAINESNINTLSNLFGTNFVQYENIYIATNEAENYMQEVENYVLNNLSGSNSSSVSLNDSVSIESVLSSELYSLLSTGDNQSEQSSFISVNDIINSHIASSSATNTADSSSQTSEESSEQSTSQTQSTTETSSSDSELQELYAQLAKLEQEMGALLSQRNSVDKNEQQNIEQQISSLNGQIATVNSQIQSLLNEA
jgi:hypothetical protein